VGVRPGDAAEAELGGPAGSARVGAGVVAADELDGRHGHVRLGERDARAAGGDPRVGRLARALVGERDRDHDAVLVLHEHARRPEREPRQHAGAE
jgi:hypothetical protein